MIPALSCSPHPNQYTVTHTHMQNKMQAHTDALTDSFVLRHSCTQAEKSTQTASNQPSLVGNLKPGLQHAILPTCCAVSSHTHIHLENKG